MPKLTLSVLGPFGAYLDERPLTQFRTKSVQALLVYLACQPEVHRREHLMTLLWPGLPQKSAQASLRQTLYLLRQAIPELPAQNGNGSVPLLLTDRQTVQMNPDGRFQLDTRTFTDLLREPETSWSEAVALYRGDFLTDFYLPDSAPFEEWTAARRGDLRRQALTALDTLTTNHIQAGELDTAESYARRQLEIDNLRESAHRQLMEILARNGRRRAALSHYETCCQLLQTELDIEPTTATQRLYKSIRSGEFDQIEEVSDTPSLAQQVTPTFKKPKIRHNLPSQSTPFFGRDSELQKLNGFINNPEIKLVTIVGPGGIGKTRLALEIARHQVDNFERGVWIVSLTKLAAVEEIVPAIAQALNMSFFGGGTPKQQLLDYLRNKSLFLVIDNFEHLLAGVRLVSEIIQNAPQIKILVTSREPLRLYEEQIFPLDGLTYTPECVHEADAAVQLFLNRACRQRPNLTLASADLPPMTTICRQVEGLPLGLELAAAWVDVLSLVDIADELQQSLDLLETDLRNVSERHQSLRTVFDASWQRLQEDERRLFAQLSIFRGGFTREAARQICAPDANHASFHRQLAALTRKSFLTYEPDIGRYFIHELMRQYGVEKLAEDGERATTVHHRHAAYYCEYFQLLYKELNGPRQKEAVKEIEADLENGRAAWNWVANHKMLDKIQKIILFWDRFLVIWRSRYQESDNLYATLIENLDEAKSILAQQLLIQALICRAKSKFCLGQHEEWDRLRQRAQKFFFQSPIDEIELWPGKSFVLRTLYSSDLNKRKEWCQQGLEIARRMDDRLEERVCLLILGDIANDQGKFDEAKELFEEFMEMVNLIGSRQSLGDALSRLSTIALRQYRFEEAIQLANEGIAAYSEFEDQAGVAACLYRLGDSYLYRGQYIKAIKAHCDSLNLSEEIGYQNEVTRSHFRLSHAYLHAGEYRKSKAMAETFQQMEKGNNYHRANALTMLGNNAMIEKNDSTTASYFAESKAIMPTTTGPIDLIWHQGYHVVALVHCKKLDEARQVIVDALRLKVLAPTGIILFAAIALFYWADNQWERAIELYALACKNPYAGKSQWVADVVGKNIVEAAAALPTDIVEAARERGRKMDMQEMAVELLADLTRGK